jgi:hypothetical protein
MKASKDLRSIFNAKIRNAKQSKIDSAEWGVYSVKKDGSLYAKPGSYHNTEEEANAEMARLQKLNPSRRFAVKAL